MSSSNAQLTTKLDMSAAQCRVDQPCSLKLTPHRMAAQKNPTTPTAPQIATAASLFRTETPNGGPSCSAEPAVWTSTVAGRNHVCTSERQICQTQAFDRTLALDNQTVRVFERLTRKVRMPGFRSSAVARRDAVEIWEKANMTATASASCRSSS